MKRIHHVLSIAATLFATPARSAVIEYFDGLTLKLNPNGTSAGLNVGAHPADPASLNNGDLWYNSTGHALKARINGATVSLGAGGSGGDALTSNPLTQFTGITPSNAEFNFVDGVTSAIQTQLDARQPLSSELTAIGALATANYGRSLLTLADAGAGRTALGLGSIATQAAGSVTITGGAITGTAAIYVQSGTDARITALTEEGTIQVQQVGWTNPAGLIFPPEIPQNLEYIAATREWVGAGYQTLDPDLATYAGISPSANVQTLLGSADYAGVRTSLGLGSAALLAASDISDARTRSLTAMSLVKTVSSIAGVSAGISGATYNMRSGTLFLVRNVSGAAGNIYEVNLEGVLLRTIANSNFEDTEAVEYVTSFRNAAGTLYDVLLVAEEDHTTAASEQRLTLCLLTPTATTLDRTAINGTDPDNVTTTTAYSGGTTGNLGLETAVYDSRRGRVYYTLEKRTMDSSDAVTWDNTGVDYAAKILQRAITATSASLAFGSETVLCSILPLFTGGTVTDISDGTYDRLSDTIVLLSDESDKAVRIDLSGNLIETLATLGLQPEGVALHPDSDQLFVAGEAQEFYRYELGVHRSRETTFSTYGAGTNYALTATSSAVDFGTTDPAVTLTSPGTYRLTGQVVLNYNGATFAANRNVTLKLRRTNNTAADIANGSVVTITGVVTTVTGTFLIIALPAVDYTTINSTDSLTIFADVAVIPSAGSLDAQSGGTFIRAERLY